MDRILKLIGIYKKEQKRARAEYDRASKDTCRKLAFGEMNTYRRVIADLSAVVEHPLREQANELLPHVSNSVCGDTTFECEHRKGNKCGDPKLNLI